MDKLTVMHAFCRIVERGSFARAAEDLEVSAGLLSREIKQLEQSLGCSLLTRTTRSMSLTEQGRNYHDEARRILDAVNGMEARVRRDTGAVHGHLRVNAPGSFGQIVIAPMLPELLATYPSLTLSLALDDRVVDMVEGGFDLTIRIRATLPDSNLVARRLADIGQRLYAAPAYLAAHGTPAGVDALAAHRCVAYLLADSTTQWELDGPGGRQLVRLEPQLRVGSSLVLRDMLVAGQGIGALPDFIADAPVRAGHLVRVLPQHALPARHVYAVTASRHGVDAKAAAFLAQLQATLAGGLS